MINELVTENALEPRKAADRTSSYFVILKKNGDLRFLQNFCELNKHTKREEELTERIEDTIDSVGQFTHLMLIDLAKGCYASRWSEQAYRLCGIVLPWGTHRHKCLP